MSALERGEMKIGDYRVVETFLWIPRFACGRWMWLEWVRVREVYHRFHLPRDIGVNWPKVCVDWIEDSANLDDCDYGLANIRSELPR